MSRLRRATITARTARRRPCGPCSTVSAGIAGRVWCGATPITHPGVYCLRTNVDDWDEETLWRTYTALTDVEAVFRSLKSELGLRPIFHRTRKRSGGHLFITVIAYQLVQTVRRRLGEQGQNESWASLRRILEGQQRVTGGSKTAPGPCNPSQAPRLMNQNRARTVRLFESVLDGKRPITEGC